MKQWGWVLISLLVLAGCGQNTTRPNQSPSKAAEVNVELGIAYMQQGKKVVAMEKLKKAIDEDPNYTKAHTAIAVLYESLGEYDMADKHFRRALSLDPKNSSAHNNYGGYLCRRGKRDEAVSHFDQAAANPLYDKPEMALTNAALCLARDHQEEREEQYLRQALQRNPFYPMALLNMAKLSLEKENYLSARAYLQRYEGVARHTAESLAIGIEAETKLGDKDAVSSYRLLLKNNFPTSPQAERLIPQSPEKSPNRN